MAKTWQPLSREEVIAAVERRGPARIPLVRAKWWGEGLWEQYDRRLAEFDRFPEDYADIWLPTFDPKNMKLSWFGDGSSLAGGGHDSGSGVLPDWKHLDEFLDKLPDPAAAGFFPEDVYQKVEQARKDDRYILAGWWSLFFERPWTLRGMENLMMDYYLYPEEIHRLHDGLCKLYEGILARMAKELRPDGFWTSDDLGNQRQVMMGPKVFRDMIKPYYQRVGDACRKGRMHFWLHSCGNNTEIMDDLIEAGVTVFHPVQKHTMDEVAIAKEFGSRITFLVGFDVQHILQEATHDGVRAEVRHLIDTFDSPAGGMCMAAGNGIVAGTPFENIEAFLDESLSYGQSHRAKFGRT